MKFALLFILSVCLSTSAVAETFKGRVVAVSDGDTIRVLTTDNQEVKVRLADIDAPEKGQPHGERSKEALSKLIFGKVVEVEWREKDRYSRTIGTVWYSQHLNQRRNINYEMVVNGDAWVYRKYSKDPDILKLEKEAQTSKRGLWALQPDQIIAPWDWRKSSAKM
jgi:endonuclease YncB( thermonuclease family)